MFALSELLDVARPLPTLPLFGDGPDVRELLSKEYRFPVVGAREIRMPKDLTAVVNMLTAAGPDARAGWAALTVPSSRIPLDSKLGQRRAALLAASIIPGGYVLASVLLEFQRRPGSHSPTELVHCEMSTSTEQDRMFDTIEQVWADAEPAARAAAGGVPALWVGGDPYSAAPSGHRLLTGVCAAFGLEAEVVRDASRHVRSIATRLGSSPPPYLIVWRPFARGTEPTVAAFRKASVEGQVMSTGMPRPLSITRTAPSVSTDAGKLAPAPGEERFYIKFRGSKKGDVMIEVPDCGHGQWGSDVRHLAPRAYKGIIAGEKAAPTALFRCSRCKKNRWRARY